MKINDANVGGLSSNGTGATQGVNTSGEAAAVKTKQGAEAGNVSADQVQLSNLSAHVRAAASESPERAAHLEKLSAVVESGKYQVDTTDLSKKIIDDSIKQS